MIQIVNSKIKTITNEIFTIKIIMYVKNGL